MIYRVTKPNSPPFLASGHDLVPVGVNVSKHEDSRFEGTTVEEAKKYLVRHGVEVRAA